MHAARWGQTFADPLASAMVKAWNTFARPTFVERLVDGLDHIDLLNATNEPLQHIEGVGAARQLTRFSASLGKDVALDPLRRCLNLESLTLGQRDDDRGLDLSCLRELPKLEALAADVRDQAQLANVAACAALRRVSLTIGTGVQLAPLVPETVLRRRGLPTSPPADLSPLLSLGDKIRRGDSITIRDARPVGEATYVIVLTPTLRALLETHPIS